MIQIHPSRVVGIVLEPPPASFQYPAHPALYLSIMRVVLLLKGTRAAMEGVLLLLLTLNQNYSEMKHLTKHLPLRGHTARVKQLKLSHSQYCKIPVGAGQPYTFRLLP